MVRVPVPADGTRRLAFEPVKLHTLDTLFKSQVDIEGAPGQLSDAQVHLVSPRELAFEATVEDAETGETRPIKVRLPVEVPEAAPEAGGPLPEPPDEDELDWEDEDGFDDLGAEPVSEEEPAGKPTGGKGLEALLKALVSPDLDGSIDDLEARARQEGPAEEEPDEEPEEEAPDQPVVVGLMSPEEETASFLTMLVDNGHLELSNDGAIGDLVPGTHAILQGPRGPGAKARQLSAWLMDQEAVEELYIDDDSLEDLIEKW